MKFWRPNENLNSQSQPNNPHFWVNTTPYRVQLATELSMTRHGGLGFELHVIIPIHIWLFKLIFPQLDLNFKNHVEPRMLWNMKLHRSNGLFGMLVCFVCGNGEWDHSHSSYSSLNRNRFNYSNYYIWMYLGI